MLCTSGALLWQACNKQVRRTDAWTPATASDFAWMNHRTNLLLGGGDAVFKTSAGTETPLPLAPASQDHG
jgi:hypothetical protein